jgi:hypothetical protein
MHDNDIAHQALERAAQRFENLAAGHVPDGEQFRELALGLAELTHATMKINSQILDIENASDECICSPP